MSMRHLALPLLLAGCTGATVNAPSLLPRAIETRGDAEPASPDAAPAADTILDAEIARRVAAFDASAKDFAAAAALVERVSARPLKVGSEAWLDAQQRLGALDGARAASEGALADLDALAIARATANAPPYPPLDTAIAAAEAEVAREAATAAKLGERLR